MIRGRMAPARRHGAAHRRLLLSHDAWIPEQTIGMNLRHISFEGTRLAERRGVRPVRSHGRRPVAALAPAHATGLPGYVLQQCGLDPRAFRDAPMSRRLPACLRMLRAASVDEACAVLAATPGLLPVALNTLLVGVTEFFRDRPVFDALQTLVIPALTAAPCTPIRVWSAGAADGAELYSVAILLAEAGVLDRCELVGTDCRPSAVERARSGLFEASSVAALPAHIRQRYFTPAASGEHWQVADSMRVHTRWTVADVCSSDEPGPWDLVLCRNVAIYLSPWAAADVFSRLARLMASRGYLVVGKADRPATSALRSVARCIYQVRRSHGEP
jgi:chemotaxis protein methyltransferase CheR